MTEQEMFDAFEDDLHHPTPEWDLDAISSLVEAEASFESPDARLLGALDAMTDTLAAMLISTVLGTEAGQCKGEECDYCSYRSEDPDTCICHEDHGEEV